MDELLQKVAQCHQQVVRDKENSLKKDINVLKEKNTEYAVSLKKLGEDNAKLEREKQSMFTKGRQYAKECDLLEEKNKELEQQVSKLLAIKEEGIKYFEDIKKECDKLKEECDQLKVDNEKRKKIKEENIKYFKYFEKECDKLKEERDQLKVDNEKLKNISQEVARYSSECARLKRENQVLKKPPVKGKGFSPQREGNKILNCIVDDNACTSYNAIQSPKKLDFAGKILSLEKKTKRTKYAEDISPEHKRQRLTLSAVESDMGSSETFPAAPRPLKPPNSKVIGKRKNSNKTNLHDVPSNDNVTVLDVVKNPSKVGNKNGQVSPTNQTFDPDATRLPTQASYDNTVSVTPHVMSSTPKDPGSNKRDYKQPSFDLSSSLTSDSEIIPCSPVFNYGIRYSLTNKTTSPMLFQQEDEEVETSQLLLAEDPIPSRIASGKQSNRKTNQNNSTLKFKNTSLPKENSEVLLLSEDPIPKRTGKNMKQAVNDSTFKKPKLPFRVNKSNLVKFNSSKSVHNFKCDMKIVNVESLVQTEEASAAKCTQLNGSVDPDFHFSQYKDTQSLEVLAPETLDVPLFHGEDIIQPNNEVPEVTFVEETKPGFPPQKQVQEVNYNDEESLPELVDNLNAGYGGKGKQRELNQMEDSFDVVRKDGGLNFAHVEVIRKQDERRRLPTYSCKQCYQYYNDGTRTIKEIEQKMGEVCRHRASYVPPSTPEGFFRLGFPDTPPSPVRGKRLADKPMKKRKNPLK